jgi:hypothetical protein
MYEIVSHDVVVMHSDGDLGGKDFRDHFAIDKYSIPLTSHVEDQVAFDNGNNIVETLSPPDDRAELQGQVGINEGIVPGAWKK